MWTHSEISLYRQAEALEDVSRDEIDRLQDARNYSRLAFTTLMLQEGALNFSSDRKGVLQMTLRGELDE